MVLLKTQPRGIHSGYIIKRYRGGVKTLFSLENVVGLPFKIELILKNKGVLFFFHAKREKVHTPARYPPTGPRLLARVPQGYRL